MNKPIVRLPLLVAVALLAGCAGVSRREGEERIQALLNQRVPSAVAWRNDAAGRAAIDTRVNELLATPLTPESAFEVGQLRNPRMAAEYAQLGLAQADVVEASRIGNPTFSGSALKDGGPSKITSGLSLPLSDLLLLPARRRLADGEYERAQQRIAASLVDLSIDVTERWYTAASAGQVAAMREAVAQAADASAELAQRFFAAGNISALELKLEQAAASQARIAATMAQADAMRDRLALNAAMGLSGAAAAQWRLDVPLAAPVAQEEAIETLQSLAREHRLDLMAARREVMLLEDALGVVRRWRLLGAVDIGVEREKEPDGARLTGPTLSLALPIFNQGQAAVARAQAQLELARSNLAQLELDIDNEVQAGFERVAALRAVAERYREGLVPQREAVVARQVERHNYMLIGVFELLLAKQQEYDAYQGYLEAVRDYWLARAGLMRAIGTRLPSASEATQRTIGVDAILASPASATGHEGHDRSGSPHTNGSHGDDPAAMHRGATPESSGASAAPMNGMDHGAHNSLPKPLAKPVQAVGTDSDAPATTVTKAPTARSAKADAAPAHAGHHPLATHGSTPPEKKAAPAPTTTHDVHGGR
ncbi:MAG: TolC family protein [Rhodanobacteraceae bacterium]|nr:TolC family protein [Rhodanobacteraceae bacterium]